MNPTHRDYYYIIWTFSLVLCVLYPFLRIYAQKALRDRKISKTKIKELLAGKKNFWFYESLHSTYNIGGLYYANKVFLLSILTTLVIHILVGWFKLASIIISLSLIVACVSFSAMTHLTMVAWCAEHNKKNNNGVTLSTAIAIEFFPVLILLSVIIYSCKLWL